MAAWYFPTNWFEIVLEDGACLKMHAYVMHIVLHMVHKSLAGIRDPRCSLLELMHHVGLWVEACSYISLGALNVLTNSGQTGDICPEVGGLVVDRLFQGC